MEIGNPDKNMIQIKYNDKGIVTDIVFTKPLEYAYKMPQEYKYNHESMAE